MKRSFLIVSVVFSVTTLLFTSCKTYLYSEQYTPEESSLNLVRITDENSPVYADVISYEKVFSTYWGPVLKKVNKPTHPVFKSLSLSPDGKELAYISEYNKVKGVCLRSVNYGNQVTQRTFKDATTVYWGQNDQLYFSTVMDELHRSICSINAHSGSAIKQLTKGNWDRNPVLSADGKKILFERRNGTESSIWCYDLESSSLSLCCSGYCPYPINDEGTIILCCRKNNGRYGIWLVDYKKGTESLIISDEENDFTCPVLSPDKEWILCEATSYSQLSQKFQMDIYCVKMDGTQLTQLTSHPEQDLNPVWSVDGKHIYFLSTRGNEARKWGIWRMDFNL